MIYFVTSNLGKFEEARYILGELEMKNIGYTEVQADTLEEVVQFGLREVQAKITAPIMIEDAGVFITSLNGFPGVYSAYVQRTIGNDGILGLMQNRVDRRAFFRSVVGYVEPGLEPVIFRGEVHGTIGFKACGSMGFGYDPIFYVGNKSLAEMNIAEKNMISHRGKSLALFKQWLTDR
ncbi:MAG: XTP/dITP diphosphatase [Methanotrichaceae archaeon]|nr:XTP/dITP diphosphatase [Methanotrichaceae archaeon]